VAQSIFKPGLICLGLGHPGDLADLGIPDAARLIRGREHRESFQCLGNAEQVAGFVGLKAGASNGKTNGTSETSFLIGSRAVDR
jgi:hypothetical protein